MAEQTEDLKAFERRLTEVISGHQPAARFWRIIFIFVSMCTMVGAWTWLWDPETSKVTSIVKAYCSLCLPDKNITVPQDGDTLYMRVFMVSLSQSLWNHPFFTISCTVLLLLFLFGIHKRVVAASIIASRCRTFLAEYNMSCDDNGKLILKPRPAP